MSVKLKRPERQVKKHVLIRKNGAHLVREEQERKDTGMQNKIK
jgi:hypothetical protein